MFKTAALFLGLAGSATAQNSVIAGYLARSDATAYLELDLIQKELEDLIGDETCVSFALADAFYKGDSGTGFDGTSGSGVGAYFSTIPTYTGSEAIVTSEYTTYYDKDDFHDIWAKKAIKKTKTTFRRGNVNFGEAFPTDTTGSGDCVGFEEVLKKGLAYTSTLYEMFQLCQEAIDWAEGTHPSAAGVPCIAQRSDSNPANPTDSTCQSAVAAWDGCASIYVGSLEGEDGGNTLAGSYGKSPYTLADKRCRNFANCGPNRDGTTKDLTSPVNTAVLGLLAAGSQAAYVGDYRLMEQYLRLISNKVVIPLIQGTLRYFYRLSDEEGGPGTFSVLDKEVGEGGAFIFGVLPKLWSCSSRGEKKITEQTKIGGGVAGVSAVNYQNVRLALECNYRCLGITCAEVGSLFDGDATVKPGAQGCDDEDNGSENVCDKPKKTRKNACKQFTGKAGIKDREKLKFNAPESY